jgi:hypothetical protein
MHFSICLLNSGEIVLFPDSSPLIFGVRQCEPEAAMIVFGVAATAQAGRSNTDSWPGKFSQGVRAGEKPTE